MKFDMKKVPRDQQVAIYAAALSIMNISDLEFRQDILTKQGKHHIDRYNQMRKAYDRMGETSKAFMEDEIKNQKVKGLAYQNQLTTLKQDIDKENRRLNWIAKTIKPEFKILSSPYYTNTAKQRQMAFQIVLSYGPELQDEGQHLIDEVDKKCQSMEANKTPPMNIHYS